MNNDDAILHIISMLNLKNTSGYIADKLLETNESTGDNPLIPYDILEKIFYQKKRSIKMDFY